MISTTWIVISFNTSLNSIEISDPEETGFGDNETKEVKSYKADVKIHCAQCGLPFEFIGLPMGVSPNQPMCSIDAQQARMPIRPSERPEKDNTKIVN